MTKQNESISAEASSETVTFGEMKLAPAVLTAVAEVGYETPSPIQAATIPLILEGRDVLGQAQTGTGKTAAFALPMLSRIDLEKRAPQLLVLAPTRELAIQVAEAFQRYAHHMQGFHVLPIYGGQSYDIQLKQLKRGAHVVVGTPGRVMDHIRRKTLDLSQLSGLVLDEADEMLRMGFIDDVQWILDQTPDNRQIALFSATMPPAIRKIAQQHLNNPAQVTIKVKEATAETIRQRYWMVSGRHKLDALTRILEVEDFDAMIIFVRTKTATEEIAEKLEARGFAAAALNGDITQKQREATVNRLKKRMIDIIVATDVAARGLDVERISHVVNYDIPHDTESYVHRIGRTGRAGREGDAILFVAPREKRMLYAIEKATRKTIEIYSMPTSEAVNDKRIAEFKQRITDTLEAEEGLELFTDIVEQYAQDHNVPGIEIAAALAKLLQGDKPMLLTADSVTRPERAERNPRFDAPEDKRASMRNLKSERFEPAGNRQKLAPVGKGMQRYRLEVGAEHGVKPSNIVGAIANEIGLESEFIGQVTIFDDHSTVDLPEGMPGNVFKQLKQVWVCNRKLDASLEDDGFSDSKPGKPRGDRKGDRFKVKRADRRPQRAKDGRKGGAKGGAKESGGRKPPRCKG